MQNVQRKPIQQVTMREFLTRARDWVKEAWVRKSYYVADGAEGYRDDGEGEAFSAAVEGGMLYDDLAERLTGVCSVGAMRVAFAEIVDMPPSGHDEFGDYWYENLITGHPFYKEGMRVLGRAFYALEQQQRHLTVPQVLLNGAEGLPYSMDDVEEGIVNLNDTHLQHARIVEAFELAVQQAPNEPLALSE